jgi:hypothetical protein
MLQPPWFYSWFRRAARHSSTLLSEPMRNPDAMRMFFRLTLFLPLAGTLLLLDWIGARPPVRRLVIGPLETAADALISGQTIWCRADMHDLKPLWIERLHKPQEVLVLGSSRVMQISPEWFRPRRVLNAAMPAGDFEDSVAAMQLCLETGKTPELVLLELNPTLTFEKKARIAPALAPYFRRALMHYGIFPPTFFTGLLTLDAFRWDPRVWLEHPVWRVSQELPSGAYRMRPDGTSDLGFLESGQTPDDVERGVIEEMHHLDRQFLHWRTTSQPAWFDLKILRAFLDDLRVRHIRLVVLMVPVHPAAYDYYRRQGGYDESWIRREMASRGITVIGSYSPVSSKATKADFFDDVHVRAALLRRLLTESKVID